MKPYALFVASILLAGPARGLGIGGPYLVKDIIENRQDASSGPSEILTVGEQIYFRAYESHLGWELWKSDGTEAGTVLVKDINPGVLGSFPYLLIELNGTLYFAASSGVESGLWKSDGTEGGTVQVDHAGWIDQIANLNGTLWFFRGPELWKSDGTPSGTILVKSVGAGLYDENLPFGLTYVNGNVYFAADDGVHGYELWKSDGTEAGTVLVKDINVGGPWSSAAPSDLTELNGALYFSAFDPVGGHGAVAKRRHRCGDRPRQGHPTGIQLELSSVLRPIERNSVFPRR